MKPQTGIVRLKQFQLRERHRQLTQLETMTSEFERMAANLEAQIAAEEAKAGITDTSNVAYPTFALAARGRRDNLLASISNLHAQTEDAEHKLQQAQAELEHAQALEKRDGGQNTAKDESIVFIQRRAIIG
ncbi:MAG: Hypothetical protein BHV28_04760 [Candidatus Tokpelaia hoelldobleri]|uniref:Flagellar FliJ protein n=1 Tax=Candidatus Tokpelaia hoelldobleri TaxID=1902579 RepID=A0A1U9JTJ8_9HYPH|nr:MAG: Hypothetical protein BHV28_04760 [Candidatus Tokpelaia hoelldoblerii]